MAELPSMTLECETVTPLFLGGADPRGAPELRAPSLRGALRYWFRALLAEPDLFRLRQREAEVFGNQERASPLSIRVSSAQPPKVQTWDPRRWPPGLVYLGFAFRSVQGQLARQAFDAGWRFQVLLSARHDDVLRQALASFWALLHVGGLGSRTRRGFGTIRIVSSPGAALAGVPELTLTASSPQELAAQLSKGMRAARLIVQEVTPKDQARGDGLATPYTALAPGAVKATVLGHVWPSWHAALADVGQLLAEHRQPLSPTMRELANPPSGDHDYPRAGFGLPIVYYRPADRQSRTLVATTISRRASPLWIRPLYLAPEEYAVVLWVSHAPFWPDGSRLKIADRTTLHGNVSLTGVEQFIAACIARWSGHEVKVE